jgi:hypothetical protein
MALTATESEIIEAVKLLNGSGRWITLQQCLAMAQYEMYQSKENRPKTIFREAQGQLADMGQGEASEETTWTGYYRGVKKKENIIYPVWG